MYCLLDVSWTCNDVMFCVTVRYEITTAKPAGAISGVQHTEGGPVEYSNQLPQSCRLSR